MSTNADVFTALSDSSFFVTLSRKGSTLKLKCRELPFTTLLNILTSVVSAGQAELVAARRQLFEDIVQAGVTGVSPEQAKEMVMPLLMATIQVTPHLMEELLTTVIFDATPNDLKCMTLEDTACVINAVILRIDFELLADKIRPVFSHAAKTLTKVMNDQAEVMAKEHRVKKKHVHPKSSPQKQSQE